MMKYTETIGRWQISPVKNRVIAQMSGRQCTELSHDIYMQCLIYVFFVAY